MSPPRKAFRFAAIATLFAMLCGALTTDLRGEAMLQYFNTSWSEITAKMPELAEAGYDSLWLPPPTKGSGGLSVGYDLFDRFDLGSKDQRGTIATRYGTEADLLRLIETAHRFGIRVYLDNIMNHNAFDVPGYNESTSVNIYPGFVPEDFHLKLTPEGFYRKWDNVRDWNDAWQVQHLNFSDLIDIAQEPGTTNENFGQSEGSTFPKIKFLRQPNNPEYYCYDANGNYVGFGPNNGLTAQYLQQHSDFYSEYVQDFLNRAARWEVDRTKADGLRLDAVKHVRADFFGATFGADKDFNDYGYNGQVQRQFNLSRGFNDAKFNYPGGDTFRSNLRETVFDTEKPRHNAMMFGEHLGEPPAFSDYFNSGMRLVDSQLQNNMNGILGNPSATLSGLDQSGSFGFGVSLGVMFAQSHDNDYYVRRELQLGLYLTRAGLGSIYTDGNHQAQTLSQSGGAFPRHANTNFLGQFSDPKIPNLLYIHNQFARGYQVGRWSDSDFVAYERIDKRENASMSDEDGVTMLFLMNDNYSSGQSRGFTTAFGHTAFSDDAYLYNYSSYGGGFYVFGSQLGTVIVPPGGYFAFSWRNPEETDLWAPSGGKPITILQSGSATGTLTYTRKDGPDGDPNFNPYGVTGTVAGSYSYPYTVPRVTGTDLSFVARADGSTENILMELDGGVDINSQIPLGPTTGEKRDHPPGLSTDVFLGYEQAQFVGRQYGEKFAAIDTSRCKFGSAGAETYLITSGTFNAGPANANNYDTEGGNVASWIYHEPNANTDQSVKQYIDNGSTVTIWAKTNSVGAGYRMFLYYTTDGSFPEGAGGVGRGTTQVVEMHYNHNDTGNNNWWGTSPPITKPTGDFRYKVSIFKDTTDGNSAHPVASIFPSGATPVYQKKHAMTTFQIPHFNAATALVYPHNDNGVTQTGLSEGFHVIRARAFLNRAGRASIYNTFTQVFYYDAAAPGGEVKFPGEGDTIGGSQYGVVVRTDPSVTEVWYKIVDTDANNDDTVTGASNGNGAWVLASQATPSLSVTSSYPNEWRFNYVNIPSSGSAQILVRLRELSSADSTQFADTASAPDDQAKHYTTLVRTVNTNGPLTKMFVAFPQFDGQVVDNNYVMKVWFSKSLADGTTTSDLINRFLIRIKSSDSANDLGVVQGQSNYHINYNVTSDYHELAYQLPNLYNGNPNFLHTIDVTYTPPPGGVPHESTRLVKAKPVVAITDNIVTPPEFDSDGKTYQIVLPDVANPTPDQRTVPIRVETDTNATNVTINFTLGSGTTTLTGTSGSGTSKYWDFNWTGVAQGDYQFVASVTTPNGNATNTRDAHVVFRQIVSTTKGDSDDDGLSDTIETTPTALPTTNSETWTNGQVHLWEISGKTKPNMPDTDGDDLSDGLELGWGGAIGDTSTTTDTNGDGVPNFQPDLDPPIFNTTDNANRPGGYDYYNPWPYNLNNSRTDLIAGTMTDPNKPDTDDDGVNDGYEDRTWSITTGTDGNPVYHAIHNGRVDIGVPDASGTLHVIAHPPTVYNTSKIDRIKVLGAASNAVWLETDPNNGDTDGDGSPDGQEDANHNGIVDLAIIDRNQTDVNGNFVVLATFSDFKQSVTVQGSAQGSQPVTFRYSDFCATFVEPTDGKTYTSTALDKQKLNNIFKPSGNFRTDGLDVIWLDTDPRLFSTSGDGLPDGWKIQHGLDPWDDGVVGHTNLHTGKIIANANNGPNGDPDGDGFTNLQEYINGTDPLHADTGAPPPPGSITIGPSTTTTIGGVSNDHSFTDWTINDLIALDPYDGDGSNNQGSDIYHGGDGFDSSRDMVAFYAHDGGSTSSGGDGNFYFRVDMHDLQAYAEAANLDIYVVINFGHPGTGEYNLPDQVDTGTTMGWQAVVACYSGNNGRVYLWNKNATTHSTGIGQDLSQFGVTSRDQNSANGFLKAYFNSDIDAVEFSISRQALLDAGWNGLDASDLIYQVFTTRDGTADSPQGAGDIGGRSDIRDSIRNDWIASDYWNDQANIAGANSVLRSWIGVKADNDRGKRVKVVSVVHGNQAIQPANYIQSLINTGSSSGYYRPLDVHEAYNVPLTLHVTPTLASAIQWAKSSTAPADVRRDGPSMNMRIGTMIGAGQIDLLGSTFSDHMMPYYSRQYNRDNVSLANQTLTSIFGAAPSNRVFWTPERVSDAGSSSDVDGVGVIEKVADLGYGYTFIDQMRHVFKWFGRNSALGNDGYRINRINGVNCFVINDSVSSQLFTNNDNGVPTLLRELLNKKARNGQQDQVVVFVNDWENFTDKAKADAYDKNIRWLASHPWIQIVTPDQIASGQVDLSQPPDGQGDTFGTVDRGTGQVLAKTSKDWIDHATEESYDNWYNGSSLEESLNGKVFDIRAGAPVGTAFGLVGSGGISNTAWTAVTALSGSNGTLASLARGTAHAATFETAFHDQTNNDLTKFSIGTYVNPDTSGTMQKLSNFSKYAQSQLRSAAVYTKVNAWANSARGGAYTTSAVAESVDIDLDGEPEYLLYNDRIFAMFEREGGRMTNAWVRDINTGDVLQVVGNPLSYSGSETEDEGNVHLGSATGTAAYRTSGFKDWFATGASDALAYVNNLFTVTSATNGIGWKFTSSDGKVTKTINLAPRASKLDALYNLGAGVGPLYVRFGMSPNLFDLLLNGQKNMGIIDDQVNGEISVMDNDGTHNVRTFIKYAGTGLNASYNRSAVDRPNGSGFDSINMRNQAQTQQLEISGTSGMAFSIGFQTGSTVSIDSEGAGIPDWWRQQYFGHADARASDLSRANDDADGDGKTNLQEYILGTNPTVKDAVLPLLRISNNAQAQSVLTFSTMPDRTYRIYYSDAPGGSWTQAGGVITGTGSDVTWTDDGTQTGSAPSSAQHRFYKVQVSLQ